MSDCEKVTGRVSAPTVESDDVRAALSRIRGFVRETPVLAVEYGGLRIHLKLELLQYTGSFKSRGALNKLLSMPNMPEAGCVAASGGNHGIAVAWAAKQVRTRARIYLPTGSPIFKVNQIKRYGAEVQLTSDYPSAVRASRHYAAKTGAVEIHAYDDELVVAGQGTVAAEIESQVPGAKWILMSVGGGGLLGGAASWFGRRASLVGVEPTGAPTLHSAIAAGKPIEVSVETIAADSLGAHRVGDVPFRTLLDASISTFQVEDKQIRHTQMWLWENLRLIAEPGGATALAAVSGGWRPRSDSEALVAVVCGSNVNPCSLVGPD